MIKYYFFLLITIVFTNNGFSQSFKEQFLLADDLVEDGNFHKALSIYSDLLGENPNNANLNFKIGFCYLNTATQKSKAIPYLEFASKHINDDYSLNYNETEAPIETLFYLGKAYHVNYRFDDAIEIFTNLKSKLSEDDDAEFIEDINREITICNTAKQLVRHPVEMDVTNLGKEINTIYSEHSPVISGDESILIFTSKRKGTGNSMTDDGQYFEDIYISSFDGKKYTQAQPISKNINTTGHDASVALSFDGTKLLIYKDDEGDGNIYMSKRKGSEWQTPQKLPAPINSKYRETHATISIDGNEIYFTSDRKGGFGGLDIYRVRKLPNGEWSKAFNLGPDINTKYDETGPYLHPDGTSLYFASKGHNTMGGFDIFVTYKDDDGNWQIPVNIGYPINTTDDDVYYIPSVDGRRAYYSSYANNSIGNYDIFRIDLSESHVRNQTVIAGYAVSPDGILLDDAIITITNYDDEVVGIYTPDPESRKFLFILPRGKTFTALFESSNVDDFEYTINVPEYSYDQTKQVVIFNEIIVPVDNEPEITSNMITQAQQSTKDTITEKVKSDTNTNTNTKKTEYKKVNKTETRGLLVANELFKDDKYIESTQDEVNTDSVKDGAGFENIIIDTSTKESKHSLWLGIILGIAAIVSSIYLIIVRKKRE